MKNRNRTVQVALDDVTVATLKGILHQVEQQKRKLDAKSSTASGQRQLRLLTEEQKKEKD